MKYALSPFNAALSDEDKAYITARQAQYKKIGATIFFEPRDQHSVYCSAIRDSKGDVWSTAIGATRREALDMLIVSLVAGRLDGAKIFEDKT